MSHRFGLSLLAVMVCATGCAKKSGSLEDQALRIFEATGESIDEVVLDPVRQQRTKALEHEATAEILDFHRFVTSLRAEAFEVTRNYDATEADFEPFLARLQDARREQFLRIADIDMRARAILTPEEWRAVSGAMADQADKFIDEPKTKDSDQ